jgi:hypothetical protein
MKNEIILLDERMNDRGLKLLDEKMNTLITGTKRLAQEAEYKNWINVARKRITRILEE